MQTELSFILFMLLICSIAVLYLYLIVRSNRKHCQNCVFFALRKESKRLGNCSRYSDHHFFWESACKSWKRKPFEHQKEAEL